MKAIMVLFFLGLFLSCSKSEPGREYNPAVRIDTTKEGETHIDMKALEDNTKVRDTADKY